MRAAIVLLLATVTAAEAQPSFVWDAPASCPDGDDVRARIERRLGRPLDTRGIAVEVTRAGKAFVARVEVTLPHQVRILTSTRCGELADAVAVVVARLASEWREIAVPPVPVATIEAVAPRTTLRVAARHVEKPSPRVWGFGVHALALSGIGTVPQVGVGGEVSLYVRRRDAFAEVGFSRWATSRANLLESAPGAMTAGLDTTILRAGWSPGHMPVRVWVGGELGVMRGAGVSLPGIQRGTAPWTALTTGVAIGWPMTRYARFLGSFEVAVPVSRVHFELAQPGSISSTSVAAARCAFGLEVGFL
ncbi:MAG TPA: hypothetical protein VK427_00890 [Kofleriaceae bacterium]|nr:hypothetical protein [Kofleriaceae bacterium]